ncbi:MAG: hypothetical protein Q7I98_06460, partial [Erysipelotrichaceae bacterium]|nr:hypothetical protein [Erysipelotrichaceae bacterium]
MTKRHPIKSGLYLAAILLILALMAGCTAKSVPPPVDSTPDSPKTGQEEQRLYQLMEELAPLEEVTAQFAIALSGADERIKDRVTSRWIDHAKYRIYEITQDFSINEDGTENDLYAIFEDVFPNGWEASGISKIKNPAQRAYFEILDKSYMKIVQYGDYVGPGFDYERLGLLTDLSKGFVSYFELSDAYYQFLKESDETGLLPYVAYTDYLLDFESVRSTATSAELISQLDPLLRWSYGVFFFGSMGSGPMNLETKTFSPAFLERLEAVVSDHPKSALADLSQAVLSLSQQSDKLEYLFYDQVQFFRRFGFDSTKGIRAIYDFQNETLFESRPEFYGFENPEVMDTLNSNLNTLMDDLKTEIQWASDPATSYNLSFYLEFANDRWASFQVAASSF